MNGNDTRLVLHDFPIFLWILGSIFAGSGALLFFQGGQEPITLVFFAIGLAFLLFANVLTITADRITRTLKVDFRSAMLHSLKEFSFDEITGIGIQRVSGRNSFTYRIVLKRRDGQVIPFRSSSSSGLRGKERLAATLREFIGVPAFDPTPAGITYAALQSYIDNVQETHGVHWRIQPIGSARWHSPDFKTAGVFLFVAQKAEGQATRGFLASLGSMFIKQILSNQFQADDTPGLDNVATIDPLDPALEPHFMAFSGAPSSAGQLLNSRATTLLADWAGRYPLKTLNKPSGFGQLTILFSPNGVYIATLNPLQPDKVNELADFGAELVKSQTDSRAHLVSAF